MKNSKNLNLFGRLLLTALILVLQASHLTAQTTEQISIELKNVPVKEVLNEIENQSNYHFIYSKELVDVERIISLTVSQVNLKQVLDIVFAGTETNYKISNQQIVISSSELIPPLAENTVTGRVRDKNGLPLIGVNVLEENTTNGTITDYEGRYQIKVVTRNPTLVFSYVGYNTEAVSVNNRKNIDVQLSEDLTDIEEVVVIGYGTRKKSDVTGSVISVSQERLENLPTTNILESMQGAVAGVTITNRNSRPGSDPEIYIRGLNSITASNAPLIVVDGVPGTGLSSINQNDIQSIEILKDASAAAIYGARGSNGVILVTTKRGSGKPKVSYNGYYGVQRISNTLNLMDGDRHIYQKMKAYELGGFPFDTADVYTVEEYANITRGAETNWQEVYLRDAVVQEHQLSVSAGMDDTKYYLSVSYTDHEHILQNFSYQRLGLRFNIDQKIGKWLTVGNSLNLTESLESGVSGNLKYATVMSPWNAPYDAAGNLVMFPANNNFIGNPLLERDIIVDNNKYQIFNNLFGIVELPLDGLTYRVNLGLDVRANKNNKYQGTSTPVGNPAGGLAEIGANLTKNWLWENIVNYEKSFGSQNLKFTGLFSAQEFYNETSYTSAYGFPTDQIQFNNLSAAAFYNAPASSAKKSTLTSVMARLTYNFKEKYYLTATYRDDGYSGFGLNKKHGQFPSVALSWNIAKEDFMSGLNQINMLKLRLSYGKNGNMAVSPYSSIANVITGSPEDPENGGNSYAYIFGQDIQYGYIVSKLGNSNLGWETTKSFNIALDYRLYKGRVSGSVEYYNANTSDLLLARSISWVNGYAEVKDNIGQTHNHGVDFSINTVNIDKGTNNFQWNSTINLAYNHNEIVDLYGDGLDDIGNEWFIGEPIDVIYDYVFDGIVQEDEDMSETAQPSAQPGEVKVKDLNENGYIDPEDRQIIGQSRPIFLYGFTNTFHYKGFDLNIFLQGIKGVTRQNDILNNSESVGNNNLDIDWWTPETPSNQYPTLRQGKVTTYWSAFQYQSADYFRIKDVSLGYTFPQRLLSKINVDRLRIYISGRNLYTLTQWQGIDPETGSYKNPNTKAVTFGINVTL